MDIKLLIPSYALAQFELYCLYELMVVYVDYVFPQDSIEVYGDANLLNMFISNGLQVDLAVLLFEYIELINLISPESAQLIKADEDYADLRKLRNKIHTFNTRGNYKKIAGEIIERQSREFGLDKVDNLNFLRNDISLYFEIKGQQIFLIGSNYYWFHTIHTINPEKTKGTKLRDFAEKMASMAKGLRSTVNDAAYNMPQLKLNLEFPRIEGVDFKSYDLFDRVGLNDTMTFRLLSVLTHISNGIFLIDSLLECEVIKNNNLWYCYFIKKLAIQFDESLDNLRSMFSHGHLEECEQLKKMLEANHFVIENLQSFSFARDLRNTIHYQKIRLNEGYIGHTTAQYIEAIYLSNTSVESMTDFRIMGEKLFIEVKQLQASIQAIFNLNKTIHLE